MLKVDMAFRNARQLKGLIGVSKEEFDALLPIFSDVLYAYFKGKPRLRDVGGGRKGALIGAIHKLFFILFYLKAYPTFDLAGFIFGADRSRCCAWVQQLLPLLEKALGRSVELPKRKVRSIEEFFELFPDTKDLFVDGAERRAQKSKSHKRQAKKYSGKKKAHTRKNIIICDENRKILCVSPTKGGRAHDLTCFKKWGLGRCIPEGVAVWADKGFIGVKNYCSTNAIMIPHKKRRGSELTHEQRQDNKLISGLRIVVEHAIGGIKRFGSMSNVYRNRKGQDDRMVSVCAAIWNLHLQIASNN